MERILQTWLDHQCRMLPGSIHAVLLTGPPDQGPYNQILFWPDDRRDHALLLRVAQAALRYKKTAIKILSNQGENSAEPMDILVCRLFLKDRLMGVVAIEMTHRSLSMQRTAMRQVQTGARWLEAMIELPLGPVLSRFAKLLGPRRLLLKVGVGITAVLLAGFFLVSTLLRVSSDSEPGAVVRHAVVAPQQRYDIKGQARSGDSVGDEGRAVTLGDKKAPIEERKPQRQDAQLPKGQGRVPTGPEQTEIAAYPVLSEEGTFPAASTEMPAQGSSGNKDHRAMNSETGTSSSNPVRELFSVEIGPIIGTQDLEKATTLLHKTGFDFQQDIGMGPVKVTRLLEGLYTRDIAHKRFKAIQNIVDSAFIISEKGKLAIYVATYHDRANAIQKIKELAQKNIKVTPVTTEIKMKGTILVVKQVDRPNIETIKDQISKLGLSVRVIKSG